MVLPCGRVLRGDMARKLEVQYSGAIYDVTNRQALHDNTIN
jgi:hypothetical protein